MLHTEQSATHNYTGAYGKWKLEKSMLLHANSLTTAHKMI